jgi:hypothetical protein
MTDVRLPASGNIQVRWHASNAFANPARPTPTEVNAGLNITDSISWNDFDFGIQASNTTNDPSLAAKSNVSDRGAMQYGGSISLYLPADESDATNNHALAYAALATPRTLGYITMQVDGELSETNTATYAGGLTQTAAEGDLIDIFLVMTSAYSHSITGEEAFRETINLMPQGEAYPNAVVSTTAPTVVVTPATVTTAEAGDIVALAATVNGRNYTRGVRWTTSDSDVATVSQNGIVTIVGVATDTATITATYLGASDTAAITVA